MPPKNTVPIITFARLSYSAMCAVWYWFSNCSKSGHYGVARALDVPRCSAKGRSCPYWNTPVNAVMVLLGNTVPGCNRAGAGSLVSDYFLVVRDGQGSCHHPRWKRRMALGVICISPGRGWPHRVVIGPPEALAAHQVEMVLPSRGSPRSPPCAGAAGAEAWDRAVVRSTPDGPGIDRRAGRAWCGPAWKRHSHNHRSRRGWCPRCTYSMFVLLAVPPGRREARPDRGAPDLAGHGIP